MEWKFLLAANRLGKNTNTVNNELRSLYEQDFDRIIFSYPFRKLQDKTQVFPMPDDDFVHTRLTHSLEVSSVGRSLGKEVGEIILSRNPILKKKNITFYDFGAIVAAASLAHDLGNPPFGHSGEDAISDYFKSSSLKDIFQSKLKPNEWDNLIKFEGNAQGFRILTNKKSGLDLTFATLASFTKYPRSVSTSIDKSRCSQKKYGFNSSELPYFQEIANELQLKSLGENCWTRHPLAFLVEAADDICYRIIDLEDGTRLGLVPFEQTKELLATIIGDSYSEKKLEEKSNLNEKLGILRAMSINKLVSQCIENFSENESNILNASFDEPLIKNIPSNKVLDEIIQISKVKIYQSNQVLEREAAGFEIIEKLMDAFCQAVYYHTFDHQNLKSKYRSIYYLLPLEYRQQIENQQYKTVYSTLQYVCDFISSLTDSYAHRLYKIIFGISLY